MVWPFGNHLTASDFLKKIAEVAIIANAKIDSMYSSSDFSELLKLLEVIQDFDVRGSRVLQEQTGWEKEAEVFVKIHEKVAQAKAALVQGSPQAAHNILKQILPLAELEVNQPAQTHKKTRLLGLANSYSPEEAFEKGILYRGVSDEEYESYVKGRSFFAKSPFARQPLAVHILDPTSATQFISLTTDRAIAKKFGKVIPLNSAKIRGNLLGPDQIRQKAGKDPSVKKLVVKNTEFILEPANNQPAELPPESFVY